MFSYQLYSSRNFPPLTATLSMLAEAGYAAVEGYGGLLADSDAIEALRIGLADARLAMPTAHFGLPMLEDDPARVLALVRILGIERIYCPYLAAPDRPADAAGWRAFGERLAAAGAPYRAAGIGFGWHNHDFEFRPTADGMIPMAEILAGGPMLEWEIDAAWVIRGGADPLEWIARHGDRITAAHVKDIAPAGEKVDEDGWADLGDGTVDWSALMAELRAAGCRHFVMEHDNPSDHRRFAIRSIAAAKRF
ncbi:MAG: sugar phosphate isomerase/epimerase [Paracoccaceae bacterium]|nr:MAG: sugar phosphate isomerase/epimerase [Paracoccaceae bacterium]